jgi:hypothetical protein
MTINVLLIIHKYGVPKQVTDLRVILKNFIGLPAGEYFTPSERMDALTKSRDAFATTLSISRAACSDISFIWG